MEKLKTYLNDITAKDDNKAMIAAKYLVDNSDVELFKLVAEKTDFLFDFVKNNVCKRVENAVTGENYKNILNFFTCYSPVFDDLFASILAKYADETLTDEMLELLESGSQTQKTYAAKYFSYIPDTIAIDALSKYIFSDWESLSYNCAQALGKMREEESYKKALVALGSEDNFEKLKAVKFFVAYAENPPIDKIFEAMRTSSMPENIAGEIAFLVDLPSILHSDNKKNVLITIDNLLSGLGEILPLSQIFQFELYELLSELIGINRDENHYHSKIAQILLKALSKIKMICTNDEYIFDEDKNTKQELSEILELLEKQSNEFWQNQKDSVLKELTHCNHRVLGALEVIKEYKLEKAIPAVINLLDNDSEIVVCEAVSTLKELKALSQADKSEILSKLKDENIKAIVNSYWSGDGA